MTARGGQPVAIPSQLDYHGRGRGAVNRLEKDIIPISGGGVITLLLKLYCSSEYTTRRCPANQGFYSAMYLLWLLNKRGIATEVADTATLPEEDIKRAYNEAVVASVAKKHKIREVFGTKRRSAIRFGKGVPALLVYEEIDQLPIDVYPHKVRQGGSTERFDVTILEYLTYLERQRTGQPTLEYENRPLTLEEQRHLTRRMQR